MVQGLQELPINPHLLARKDRQGNTMRPQFFLKLPGSPDHVLLVIDIPPIHVVGSQQGMRYPVGSCLLG